MVLQLRAIFEEMGPVIDFTVLRHRDSGESKGCGFLSYQHQGSADRAMKELDGQRTLPGSRNPLAVRLAHSAGGDAAQDCESFAPPL